MNLAVLPVVFGLVFVGELPDKTALASLVLGSRYRAWWVFTGVAAAFLMHAVLAVAAGSLLTLVPRRAVEGIVAALFLAGAVILLRERDDAEEADHDLGGRAATFPRVAGAAFAVIAVAEFGDLTQILTATLAARYHDPITVGVGAVLALWAVGALAIAGGRNLLRLIPLRTITRIAAGVMVVLAVISAVKAVAG